MTVAEIIEKADKTLFSFEILPPLKGGSIDHLYADIESLLPFEPQYINITSHRSEPEFHSVPDSDTFRRVSVRHRPGTVAIAAAIQNKYKIATVPHIICSGFSRTETEYALIDLNFLGINNLLLLRGDKSKTDKSFQPEKDGHAHATSLIEQVNDFNHGKFVDGSAFEVPSVPFAYGVAGYPEKHEESPNVADDVRWVKEKVKAGASYVVTQMFFDNQKYFDYVAHLRKEGVTVPVIPGLKPISSVRQLAVLPRVFHIDIPEELTRALRQAEGDKNAMREVGIEWCVMQAKELKAAGVPGIHFYSIGAVESVRRIAGQVF